MLIDYIKIDQRANAEYSNGQNSFEALRRTLIVNWIAGTVPAPPDYGESFCRWLVYYRAAVLLQRMRENHTSILGVMEKHGPDTKAILNFYPGFRISSLEIVQALASHLANGTSSEELRVLDALQMWFSPAFLCVNGGEGYSETVNNLLGFCPQSAQVRNSVWIVPDTMIPSVLRQQKMMYKDFVVVNMI